VKLHDENYITSGAHTFATSALLLRTPYVVRSTRQGDSFFSIAGHRKGNFCRPRKLIADRMPYSTEAAAVHRDYRWHPPGVPPNWWVAQLRTSKSRALGRRVLGCTSPLRAYPPAYSVLGCPTCLPPYLPASLPACLPTCLPAYLPTGPLRPHQDAFSDLMHRHL
jgi:hypothetical protein